MKHLLILTALLATSCSKENFKKYVSLGDGDLRVLGIVADKTGRAEGNPGETFLLTPFVVDLASTGTITATAVGCIDPGIGFGATATCEGSSSLQALTAANLTAPFSDSAPPISVLIPASILTGRLPIDQFNGVNYLVIYKVTNSLNQSVTSVKRIPISDPSKTKNNNPVISQVLASGSPLGPLAAGAAVDLSFQSPAASTETYSYFTSSGTLNSTSETLIATWFYSDGELKYFRTLGADVTSYNAPVTYPTSRGSFIVTVLRDGRGGMAIKKTTIH